MMVSNYTVPERRATSAAAAAGSARTRRTRAWTRSSTRSSPSSPASTPASARSTSATRTARRRSATTFPRSPTAPTSAASGGRAGTVQSGDPDQQRGDGCARLHLHRRPRQHRAAHPRTDRPGARRRRADSDAAGRRARSAGDVERRCAGGARRRLGRNRLAVPARRLASRPRVPLPGLRPRSLCPAEARLLQLHDRRHRRRRGGCGQRRGHDQSRTLPPARPVKPVQVGDLRGRARDYALRQRGAVRTGVGYAVSSKCDLLVAAGLGRDAGDRARVAGLLGSAPVAGWIAGALGLKRDGV